MQIYQGVVTAILAALLLNTLVNLRLLRRPAGGGAPAAGPLVSILVPARNEARTIVRCVESLARQDYPRCEILVLDDQSEDGTAALVEGLARRYPWVALLRGRPLPPGWHGKAYACAQLAEAARGDWLLFVDADTAHAPGCVSAALGAALAEHADLVTMLPRLEIEGAGEALLLPTVPLTFLGFLPLGLVSGTRWPLVAGALGQFLLFRREAYRRIGGHAAVRTDIVEDMQLSRLVKRHGGRLVWCDGTALMRVRMYRGLREVWQGLAKSAFAAIDYALPPLLPGMLAGAAVLLGPYAFLVAALLGHPAGALPIWLPLGQVALLWAAYLPLLRRAHLPRRLVFLHAATILAILAMTGYSAYQATFGGGVRWKGRTYRFGARRGREAPLEAPAPAPAVGTATLRSRDLRPHNPPARTATETEWTGTERTGTEPTGTGQIATDRTGAGTRRTGTWARWRDSLGAPEPYAGGRAAAAGLAAARLALALLLMLLGWRRGGALPALAAGATLTAWSCAVLEHPLRPRRAGQAIALDDAVWALASLAYMQRAGSWSPALLLTTLIVIGAGARLASWGAVATLAGVPAGSAIVLAAALRAPALGVLLLAWVACLMLLARRLVAQDVSLWLQRTRSP